MIDFARVFSVANRVLEENLISNPPVPVMDLVKNYGLDVWEVDLDSQILGFLDVEDQVIYLNYQSSSVQKVFTASFELGLLILHETALKENPDLGVLNTRPLGETQTEIQKEADWFASFLLLPESILAELAEKYQGLSVAENHRTLAQIFGVSPQLVSFRLQGYPWQKLIK